VQSFWFSGKQLVLPGAAFTGKGLNAFDVTDPSKPTLVNDGMCGPGLNMPFMLRVGARIIVADERTLAVND
jgi:hypothetical protein